MLLEHQSNATSTYGIDDVITISCSSNVIFNGEHKIIKYLCIDHDRVMNMRLSSKPKKYRSTYNSKHGRVW